MQLAFASLARLRADSDGFDQIEADLRLGLAREPPGQEAVAGENWRGRPRRELVLHGVSFRYAPDLPITLRDINLAIAAGTAVGIVGANGSGKTTLADLILGLLSADSGRIEIDGVALTSTNRRAWQDCAAYVPQNPILLDASIGQNIAFAVEQAAVDPQRLGVAARLAGLGPLIADLPAGLGSVIGERGVRLSGGLRQRISIARALVPRHEFSGVRRGHQRARRNFRAGIRGRVAHASRALHGPRHCASNGRGARMRRDP